MNASCILGRGFQGRTFSSGGNFDPDQKKVDKNDGHTHFANRALLQSCK